MLPKEMSEPRNPANPAGNLQFSANPQVIVVLQQFPAHPPFSTPAAEATASKTRRRKKTSITADEANLRARTALRNNPRGDCWTVRSLAKAIGCSTGLVNKLPAWHAYREEKGHQSPSRLPHPRTQSLTKNLEACIGRNDETLLELTDAQRHDDKSHRVFLHSRCR